MFEKTQIAVGFIRNREVAFPLGDIYSRINQLATDLKGQRKERHFDVIAAFLQIPTTILRK